MDTSTNMLSLLDSLMPPSVNEVSQQIAHDFRRRRLERNLSREDIAAKSRVALSNITRFEQKGLISLTNLIRLALALGYVTELKEIFSTPKFQTMEELTTIRKNSNRKKAQKPRKQ